MNLVLDRSETIEIQTIEKPVWQPLKTRLSAKEKLAVLLATPDRFRLWLNSKEPDELVGFAGSSSSCPIHEWLIDEGIRRPSVVSGFVAYQPHWYYPGLQSYKATSWQGSFVSQVDWNRHNREVTQIDAISILNKITKWL